MYNSTDIDVTRLQTILWVNSRYNDQFKNEEVEEIILGGIRAFRKSKVLYLYYDPVCLGIIFGWGDWFLPLSVSTDSAIIKVYNLPSMKLIYRNQEWIDSHWDEYRK